jgi:hypothetical protein
VRSVARVLRPPLCRPRCAAPLCRPRCAAPLCRPRCAAPLCRPRCAAPRGQGIEGKQRLRCAGAGGVPERARRTVRNRARFVTPPSAPRATVLSCGRMTPLRQHSGLGALSEEAWCLSVAMEHLETTVPRGRPRVLRNTRGRPRDARDRARNARAQARRPRRRRHNALSHCPGHEAPATPADAYRAINRPRSSGSSRSTAYRSIVRGMRAAWRSSHATSAASSRLPASRSIQPVALWTM